MPRKSKDKGKEPEQQRETYNLRSRSTNRNEPSSSNSSSSSNSNAFQFNNENFVFYHSGPNRHAATDASESVDNSTAPSKNQRERTKRGAAQRRYRDNKRLKKSDANVEEDAPYIEEVDEQRDVDVDEDLLEEGEEDEEQLPNSDTVEIDPSTYEEAELYDLQQFLSSVTQLANWPTCAVCAESKPSRLFCKRGFFLDEALFKVLIPEPPAPVVDTAAATDVSAPSSDPNTVPPTTDQTTSSKPVLIYYPVGEDDSVRVCQKCYSCLWKGKMPVLAVKNNFDFGEVPEVLKKLNGVECKMISKIVPFINLVDRRGGQHGTKGRVIAYKNRYASITHILPRHPDTIGIVRVVFPDQRNRPNAQYYNIRPAYLREALQWLVANNWLYRDIIIDENLLQHLETEQLQPPEIRVDDLPDILEETVTAPRESNGDSNDANATVVQNSDDPYFELPTECSFVQDREKGDFEDTVNDQLRDLLPQVHTTQNATTNSNNENSSSSSNNSSSNNNNENNNSNSSSSSSSSNETSNTNNGDSNNENNNRYANANISEQSVRTNARGVVEVGPFPWADRVKASEVPHFMALAFPTMFPKGLGSFDQVREGKLSLPAFVAHVLSYWDGRFAKNPGFLFYSLNAVQHYRIESALRCGVQGKRRGDREQQPSVAELQRLSSFLAAHPDGDPNNTSEKSEDKQVYYLLSKLIPYFRGVRGSWSYMQGVRNRLMAMLRGGHVLPVSCPTWFLTLSPADRYWPEIFMAIDSTLTEESVKKLTVQERNRMLIDNPLIVATIFYERWISFRKHILNGRRKPLGKIVDHFLRCEWQDRGSVHVHCLLWSLLGKDVEQWLDNEEGHQKIKDLVDSTISASLPKLPPNDNTEGGERQPENNNAAGDIEDEQEDHDPPVADVHPLLVRPPAQVLSSVEAITDLMRVVSFTQMHVCNPSCFKKSATACRYNFPRKLRDHTVIEVKFTDYGTELKVYCKRDNHFMNNCNPHILRCWRANMDLQFVGNPFGAAIYVAYYASKQEPTAQFIGALREKLKSLPANSVPYKVVQSIAHESVNARSISAQEAVWILKGFTYAELSRTVEHINVLSPEEKNKTLRSPESLAHLDPESQEICEPAVAKNSLVVYANRPGCLEEKNLHEFTTYWTYTTKKPKTNAVKYELGARIQGKRAWAAKRNRVVIVNTHPYIKVDSSDERSAYALMLLYVPWREEGGWRSSFPTSVAALENNYDKLPESTRKVIERTRKIETAAVHRDDANTQRQDPVETWVNSQGEPLIDPSVFTDILDTDEEPTEIRGVPDTERFVSRGRYSRAQLEDSKTFVQRMSDAKMQELREAQAAEAATDLGALTEAESSLNKQQAMGLNIVKSYVQDVEGPPMRLLVTGPGGVGKSHFIRIAVRWCRRFWGVQPGIYTAVLVCTPTGVAAFNINGYTVHSALKLPLLVRKFWNSVTSETIIDLQYKLRGVKMLILDEMSMVNNWMLAAIDHRLRKVFQNDNVPFGGLHVMLSGDFYQLPPVQQYAMYLSQDVGHPLYKLFTDVLILSIPQRQLGDMPYHNLLTRARIGQPSTRDIAWINSRVPPGPASTISSDCHIPPGVLATACTRKAVDSINEKHLAEMPGKTVNCWAQHYATLGDIHNLNYDMNELDEDDGDNDDDDDTSNTHTNDFSGDGIFGKHEALLRRTETSEIQKQVRFLKCVSLKIGTQVMLTSNIGVPLGLVNSSIGIVYDILYDPRINPAFHRPYATKEEAIQIGPKLQLPTCVLVQFLPEYYNGPSWLPDTPRVVPIIPCVTSFSYGGGAQKTVYRVQIPLVLSKAVTVHKTQGLTTSAMWADLSGVFSSGQAYVAVSRLRTLSGLTLKSPITQRHFNPKPSEHEKVVEEYKRLEKLAELTKEKFAQYWEE